ncbi:MAG: acetyl-CoA carboxylase biotin carboxylase subunit [Firmicutes bacterium]|nr:acetyl-CoA carboxylase biotin carboxylase subunit [Bacillota bacterium]
MFRKVLVANRGEIAVRIIRACHELDISTVAVYSEADRESLHVHMADEAVCIGPAVPARSYLNIPALISAAKVTASEAIHPGYGFLAENAYFAKMCTTYGITFIGPTSRTIELAGNKIEARHIASQVGVPVIPGTEFPLVDEYQVKEAVKQLGLPVIIKASAGGGGRGMRVVHTSEEIMDIVARAQTEAENAFGRKDVYLEKYIEEPRHIEFQLLADSFGQVIHLGERDCSVQRRHQKLIEEAPCPVLTSEMRQEIGELSVKLGKAINLRSAATVEYLMDKTGNFYFIEINPRIQVEHGITEFVTGIDLVREQIRLAAGERLELKQEDISWVGCAMECRINAEDPDHDFRPSPGSLKNYLAPGGPGVRVDSVACPGYNIPFHYDSMIAKVIVHARTRPEAINRMKRSLKEMVVDGVKTTIPFHLRVLSNAFFIQGEVNTNFVQRRLGE